MIKPSSNIEKLKTMAKQWATNQDIMILADCNPKAAKCIREDIEKIIKSEGKKCPKGFTVPMARVVAYLDIDENRISQMLSLELALEEHEKSHLLEQVTKTN